MQQYDDLDPYAAVEISDGRMIIYNTEADTEWIQSDRAHPMDKCL